MQGRESSMPGQTSKTKSVAEKKKREKKVSEVAAKAEAIGKELDKEVDALKDLANDYGRFQMGGGIKDFMVDERAFELILSDDRKSAVGQAKKSAGEKISGTQASIKELNISIKSKQNSLGAKGLKDEDKVKINNEVEKLEAKKEAAEKALSGEQEWQKLINELENMLSNNSAKENWKKLDTNKQPLKGRLAKIKDLRAAKEKAEVERDTIKSVDTLVALLDELILPFRAIITDPSKFNMTTIITKNLGGKNLDTMSWMQKGKLGFGIAGDIKNDPSIKVAGLAGDAVSTLVSNLGGVINIAATVPNLINNELKSKGQNIEDPNNLIQSNFLGSLLKDPLIYELLLNNAESMGQIIWNFQNDIVGAVRNAIGKPSESKGVSPKISILSAVKIVESLLDSPAQLNTMVEIVALNIPQFEKMFSDQKSAFNKLMKEYGIEKPELIAELISPIVAIGSILPAHHGSIKSIFTEISQILLSGEPLSLAAILAPSSKNPELSKLSVIIGEASNLLFGSADIPVGVVDKLHSMLSRNAAQIAELALSVKFVKDLGVGKDVIQNVILVAAEIIKPENHKAFKDLLDLARNVKFDEKGTPIMGVADIINFISTAAPLLKDEGFKKAVGALFKEGMAAQVKPLIASFFGEGVASLIDDKNFKMVGNIVNSALTSAPAMVEVASKYKDQLTKLENPETLTPKDIAALVPMGLELLKALDIPKLMEQNSAQLAELGKNEYLISVIKPLLPAALRENVPALIPQVINLVAPLVAVATNSAFIDELIDKLPGIIKFDEKGAPIIGATEILGLANASMPLLQDPRFSSAVGALFKEGMADQVKPLASAVLGLAFGEKIPAGIANIVEIIDDKNLKLAGNLVNGVLENAPVVIKVINTYQPQLQKIEKLVAIQAALSDRNLTPKERLERLAEARGAQLGAEDIKALMFMGIEVLEASKLSGLLKDNVGDLVELSRVGQNLIKPLLPEQLRSSDNLVPDAVEFMVSAASIITDKEALSALKRVPGEVETILKQLGEDKPAWAQVYESASNIGESFSKLLNNKEFVALYNTKFKEMINKKDTRDALKGFIDSVLQSNPEARKFHIDSEKVLKFLESDGVLTKFSSAFNDLLQKDFASRVRGITRAAGLIMGSEEARSLVWKVLIDVVVTYFRENVVPDFMKRWMAGVDIETVLIKAQGTDLAAACNSYRELPFGLSRYLVKTQNFSGQYITSSLEGMTIDNFNFKGTTFAGEVVSLKGATISGSNMNLALGEAQKVDLTWATIDIKTLESMVNIINSGKAITTDIKLSEAPVTKEAQRVLGLINDQSIRNQLETHYDIKQATFAEKAKVEKEAATMER